MKVQGLNCEDQKVSDVVIMKSFERRINVTTLCSHWMYNSSELHSIKIDIGFRKKKKKVTWHGFHNEQQMASFCCPACQGCILASISC